MSYKEQSAEETGSEDLVEVDWSQDTSAAAEDNAETIERVIETRIGRRGGAFQLLYSKNFFSRFVRPTATGPPTTVYQVEENGDPNAGFDPAREPDKAEQQFLIKWLGWSHIHNTWESEQTLRDQKVTA